MPLAHPRPRRPRSHTRLRTAGLVLALGLAAGCSGSPASPTARDDATETSQPKVVQPGKPGEPATEIDPEEVEIDDSWNHADVTFLHMMIPHHAQALEMSKLARKRAASRKVKSLAERIHAAQAPEILVMAGWLDERDMEVPRAAEDPSSYDHSLHGHDGMEGMLTPAEMERLAQARGREFDRLFLRGMVAHHEGALTMAENVATTGVDLRVSELAAEVSAGQAAEISRMEDLLRSL